MSTPSKQEYVYLIGSRNFGWYKIGKARRPAIRVSQLGILLPFRVALFGLWATCKGLTTERLMHEKYARYAINGEWFGIPLEDVVGMLRDEQPFDSSLLFSVFDPNTYENAQRLGIMAAFSNIEKDKTIISKGVRSARQKLRTEFFAQWFQDKGIEQSQENWNLYADELNEGWKQKYGHLSREQIAFCGGYVV